MKKPLFSVVIPTYNGGKTIKRLLLSIIRCSLAKDSEIVILDSESTDDTLKQIKNVDNPIVRVIKIPKSTFNHGLTRNYGAKIAEAKYVFFFTQDVEILSKDIFTRVLQDFKATQAMVVFGQQIPREKTPLLQRIESTTYFDQLNRFIDEKGLVIQSIKKPFVRYSNDSKILWWFLSDVCACYRKDYLLKYPFKKTGYGEDILFGRDIIMKGDIKLYDSKIRVRHSHTLSYLEYFRREREDIKSVTQVLGVKKKSHFSAKLKYVLIKKEKTVFVKVKNLIEFFIYYAIKGLILLSLKI